MRAESIKCHYAKTDINDSAKDEEWRKRAGVQEISWWGCSADFPEIILYGKISAGALPVKKSGQAWNRFLA